MKLDKDYKKVMNELQENFGWSNTDILPESYQDLLNDTIMAVKNLTIQRIVRSTANMEIAIKHFGRRIDEYKGKLSADEVLQTLYFLKQANEQELDIIGIGYTRYDGGDIKECTAKNMYEGGFIVRK